MNQIALLLSCEHGGNTIPAEYRPVFEAAGDVLRSHRGYDPGALGLARCLALACGAPLECETRSRLLIELNRSLESPQLFSEFSRQLPTPTRQELIEQIYLPYRERMEQHVKLLSDQHPVLHLSIHSFTPVMNGKTRRTDIGLLFDPAREFESRVATAWRRVLRRCFPSLKIHFNLPYRGTSDGLTTTLRTRFPDGHYAGIELEVNQKYPLGDAVIWGEIQETLVASVQQTIEIL